ncbi:MAG: hypothetical protein ACYTF0_09680 [Planctomycetota bacterium]|jgi:hypothetical protein
MPTSKLHILFFANDLTTYRHLIDRLESERHRIDSIDSLRGALDLLRRHRNAGFGYHLLIVEEDLANANGLDLIDDAHRSRITAETLAHVDPAARLNAGAPATGTQRIRRAVTGRLTRNDISRTTERTTKRIGSDSRFVKCHACHKAFAVPIRDEDFEAPCIHCGSVNHVNAAAT